MPGFENGALYGSEFLSKRREGLGLTEAGKIFDEKEYHSIASKVYELRVQLNTDPTYRLTPAEHKILLDLRARIPRLKEEEKKKIEERVTELKVSNASKEDVDAEEKKLRTEEQRYLRIQDALGRHIDHIIKDSADRAGKVEVKPKIKSEAKIEEKTDPEKFRKDLESKIKRYGELLFRTTKTFDRTKVELADGYASKNINDINDDLALLQEARIALESERINIAGDPAKEAQINDFILPGLKLLESKLEHIKSEINKKIIESQAEELKKRLEIWKEEIDERGEFKRLKKAMEEAKSLGDKNLTEIISLESEINSALAAMSPLNELTASLSPELNEKGNEYLLEKINELDKKTENKDGKSRSLRDRLREAKADRMAAETEKQRHELQGAVSKIEKIDDKDFESKTLESFLELKTELYKIRDDLQKQNVAFTDVDSRFDKQEARLLEFIERAKIKEMEFPEIVEIIIAKNFDPFKNAAEQGSITDPYEREIIKRFQGIYFKATETIVEKKDDGSLDESLTKEKQREHRRIKSKIWAYRYQDEHYGGQYVPAANPDNLYGKMTTRKLFRDDVLDGVINEKAYGQGPKEMLDYAVDLVADEIELIQKDENGKTIKPYHYDSLKANPDGPAKLKQHLHDKFVDTGKVTDENFKILWDLYICFDLASISLAKLQKGTKTRAHNQGTSADGQAFRCYPMEVMSHKRNRYGNLDVAQQHLLVFMGEYPKNKRDDKFIWAGNDELMNGRRVRTVEETQELIKLYMACYFPLRGIENQVFPGNSGDKAWSQSVFPDHLKFLTVSTGEIGNQEIYEVAQKGWDQMLEITIGDIGGPLTLEKIFNTNDGLYTKFINSGMGLAKVIKGEHHKWFVPMLRYFVGRLSAEFKSDALVERRELKNRLVDQLKISVSSGLQIDKGNIDKEIDELITELESGKSNIVAATFGLMSEIPEILRPWRHRMRRKERVAYMQAWYKDKTGKQAHGDISLWRVNPLGDPDIRTMYNAIEEKIPLPKIIDRSAKSKDTSEKK